MEKSRLLDWRIETALLAKEMLETTDNKATRDDEAELAEALQALTTAYVIVHRLRPTLAEVSATLSEYNGDRNLIGRAVRAAVDREEQRAAKRCEAWRKAAERGDTSHGGYLRTVALRWCEKHQNRAKKQMETLPDGDRAEALSRLGWEVDIGEEAEEQ